MITDIEQTFIQPDVDVNEIIPCIGLIRTLNNYQIDYAVEQLKANPDLQAACVLWMIGHESYWVMRGLNGYVYRVVEDGKVIYQNVL
jgi:hypothetical protein